MSEWQHNHSRATNGPIFQHQAEASQRRSTLPSSLHQQTSQQWTPQHSSLLCTAAYQEYLQRGVSSQITADRAAIFKAEKEQEMLRMILLMEQQQENNSNMARMCKSLQMRRQAQQLLQSNAPMHAPAFICNSGITNNHNSDIVSPMLAAAAVDAAAASAGASAAAASAASAAAAATTVAAAISAKKFHHIDSMQLSACTGNEIALKKIATEPLPESATARGPAITTLCSGDNNSKCNSKTSGFDAKHSIKILENDEESRRSSIDTAVATSNKTDRKWLARLEDLKTYKKKHGDCRVPRGYGPNPRLASWVAEQRKNYKLVQNGKKSSLNKERVALLNGLGFAWNAQKAAWFQHMSTLKDFHKQHGHCHVPLDHPDYPKLGLWIKEQRRHYSFMKQGKKTHMTADRIEELERIGFCWDSQEATWLERLRELRCFKNQHGNCLVPANYPTNPKLGTWVHHQRAQYRKFKMGTPCHITAERIQALESVGFVWSTRTKFGTEETVAQTPPAQSQGHNPLESSLVQHTIANDAMGSETESSFSNLDLRPYKRKRHL